jgi:putative hemolysin
MQIDIANVIATKSPFLKKILPTFVINWLKKLIQQDKINEIMSENEEVYDSAFAQKVLEKIGVFVNCSGLENIPKEGGCIVAANHPLGGVDGIALLVEIAKVRPDVVLIVNDILMNIPNFKTAFIGVNKTGAAGRKQLMAIEELFASDKCVVVFPAGFCSRRIDGKIRDVEWSASFIKKAIKYKKGIIPASITAQNSERFYRINTWRRRLGIKFNAELITLPDEMFKQKGKEMIMEFNPMISYETFSNEKQANEWAQWMREKVYSKIKSTH